MQSIAREWANYSNMCSQICREMDSSSSTRREEADARAELSKLQDEVVRCWYSVSDRLTVDQMAEFSQLLQYHIGRLGV